jgi:hypothetical protein
MRTPYKKPLPVPEMKVGVRVKLLKKDAEFSCALPGKGGLVSAVHQNYIKIDLDCGHSYHIAKEHVDFDDRKKCNWCRALFSADQIRPVTFQQGDGMCVGCWAALNMTAHVRAHAASGQSRRRRSPKEE